jgi:endonuclease/exonuclease/phosphatase family metal-dependent hydrolase
VDLQEQNRVTVAVTTEIGSRRLAFGSAHLFWEVGVASEQGRLYLVGVLTDWVLDTFADTLTIVGGDFNAVPDGLAYAYLTQRWASLDAERHGAEPAWSCPTPLGPTPDGWQAPSTIYSRPHARAHRWPSTRGVPERAVHHAICYISARECRLLMRN